MPFHDFANGPMVQQGGLTCKPNLDFILETIKTKLADDIDFDSKKNVDAFIHIQNIIQAVVDESMQQRSGYFCELILQSFVKEWDDFCQSSGKISFQNFLVHHAFYADTKTEKESDHQRRNNVKILKRIKILTRSFINGIQKSSARIRSRFGNQPPIQKF